MAVTLLENYEELQEKLNQHERFMLLKHSLTCPISSGAKQEYESYASQTDTPLYMLNIQESRSFSNQVAESFGVKHESPQVLLFKGDQVIWNTSHWHIKEEALKEADQ
ncbi:MULTISPECIES: bacillithiol system redox-active protein YtxJ [Pontibacillus]|uniref:Bacillithiol system redox-active protein YtxJ n=1 Tax=Pontibacillus chungwhensis TaxID=265426 RepID=A0ABY8UV99_9BACI|nr:MULTISPECIES: bacillithiol system redox-active protein YtxJ [Pontibacillus]MCD5323893.1 bacillithiol system redox-active protein YtxJ [Pontibacillus sp. HN14]WIF97250.1 bacillithiol system redox-active protein YtxJ [Pontibacillus chungwhensis]